MQGNWNDDAGIKLAHSRLSDFRPQLTQELRQRFSCRMLET